MNNNVFITGVCEKIPEKLLTNRVSQEGNVIGVFWARPSLLSDYRLTAEEFLTQEGRFYYSCARMLRKEFNLNEFDEAAVVTHLTPELLERFDEFGGYKAIRSVMDIANTKNVETYVDELNKANLLIRLFNSGFPVLDEVDNGKGRKIIPYDYCQKLDYQGTGDFYDALLARMSKHDGCSNSNVIETREDFTITDDLIGNFEQGQMVGTSIGYFDDADRDKDGHKIKVFPWLDSEICALRHKTTTAVIGYSSTGKSMMVCEWLLCLISNGEKVCIISNEMDSTPYYLNFIAFLAFRKFRYRNLTRTKLQTGDLNDTDKECLAKVKAYFNANFAKNIVFYQITDAATEIMQKLYRHAVLELGCTCVFYDTMKANLADYKSDQPAYLSLIRDARTIDELAKRYDTISIVSLQINSSSKGRAWIDESVISQSKQIIETMETCVMLRNCYGKSETQQGEKNYINPFRWVPNNDPGTKTKWKKEPIPLEPDANYKILFITKNRAGKNSESTNECILIKAESHLATFHEEGWCCPSRGFIGATQNG